MTPPADSVARLAGLPIPADLGGGFPLFAVIDADVAPAGYALSGRQASSGYALWTGGPGAPALVLTGETPALPRLIATGHLVDAAAPLLEAAWERPDRAVFDGGPVGPLGLRRPAIRDESGIIRFLIETADSADPLAHLFSDTPPEAAR